MNNQDFNLADSQVHFHLYSLNESHELEHIPHVGSISIENGNVQLGGMPVHTAKISHDRLSWVQEAENSYTSGVLYLQKNKMQLHGTIYHGETVKSAVPYNIVGTTVKPTIYMTKITKDPYEPDVVPATIPDDLWTDGLKLEIGNDTGSGRVDPIITLGDYDASYDYKIAIPDDPKDIYKSIYEISILGNEVCKDDPGLYLNCRLTFNLQDPVPQGTGYVQNMCDSSIPKGKVKFWKAIPQEPTAALARSGTSANTAMLLASDVTDTPSSLSVSELMQLLPNDNTNQLTEDYLIRNMKYAMAQSAPYSDWLTKFLHSEAPQVPPSQVPKITASLDWYQKDFATTYMTAGINSYKGDSESTKKLTDAQAARLTNHFKYGLIRSIDYNKQHQQIFLEAYKDSNSRLQAYINDGPTKWSLLLYKTLMDPRHLNLMINRVHESMGDANASRPLNDLSCLLLALEPTGKMASTYHQTVMAGVINQAVASTVAIGDTDTIETFLPLVLDTFLKEIASGKYPADASITITADDAKYILGLQNQDKQALINALSDFFANSVNSSFIESLKKCEGQFGEWLAKYGKYPAGLSNLLVGVAWTISIISIVQLLTVGKGWKDLDDLQKSGLVIQAVGTLAQSVYTFTRTATSVDAISGGRLARLYRGMINNRFTTSIRNMFSSFTKGGPANPAASNLGTVTDAMDEIEDVLFDRGELYAQEQVERLATNPTSPLPNAETAELVDADMQRIGRRTTDLVTGNVNNATSGASVAITEETEALLNATEVSPATAVMAVETTAATAAQSAEWGARYVAALQRNAWLTRLFGGEGAGVFKAMASAIGTIVSVALAGWSIAAFVKSMQDPHVSKVGRIFDGFIMAANILSAFALVAGVLSGISWMPVVGAFFAIGAVILNILKGKYVKPISPLTTYMEEHGVPFADKKIMEIELKDQPLVAEFRTKIDGSDVKTLAGYQWDSDQNKKVPALVVVDEGTLGRSNLSRFVQITKNQMFVFEFNAKSAVADICSTVGKIPLMGTFGIQSDGKKLDGYVSNACQNHDSAAVGWKWVGDARWATTSDIDDQAKLAEWVTRMNYFVAT